LFPPKQYFWKTDTTKLKSNFAQESHYLFWLDFLQRENHGSENHLSTPVEKLLVENNFRWFKKISIFDTLVLVASVCESEAQQ
jgi:hypothetical protein